MKKIVKYLIIKYYSGGGGANAVKSGFLIAVLCCWKLNVNVCDLLLISDYPGPKQVRGWNWTRGLIGVDVFRKKAAPEAERLSDLSRR